LLENYCQGSANHRSDQRAYRTIAILHKSIYTQTVHDGGAFYFADKRQCYERDGSWVAFVHCFALHASRSKGYSLLGQATATARLAIRTVMHDAAAPGVRRGGGDDTGIDQIQEEGRPVHAARAPPAGTIKSSLTHMPQRLSAVVKGSKLALPGNGSDQASSAGRSRLPRIIRTRACYEPSCCPDLQLTDRLDPPGVGAFALHCV
jgi:hypothetical protein